MTATVSAEAYRRTLNAIMDQVSQQASGPVQDAADLVAASVRSGGVLQAFGSGHSEALTMELAGRAGGLVPTSRIALRDVVIHGGESPDILSNGILERDPNIAARLFELAAPNPADVFVIASNSGVNGSVVEMARIATSHDHPVIAITSLAHTRMVESRHPSGAKLVDLADVVLDNGAPYGDAVLDLPDGGKACAVSSVTAALLAQMLTAEVVRRILDAGEAPPVYVSSNVPEGDEHNRVLEERYAGRIRRTA